MLHSPPFAHTPGSPLPQGFVTAAYALSCGTSSQRAKREGSGPRSPGRQRFAALGAYRSCAPLRPALSAELFNLFNASHKSKLVLEDFAAVYTPLAAAQHRGNSAAAGGTFVVGCSAAAMSQQGAACISLPTSPLPLPCPRLRTRSANQTGRAACPRRRSVCLWWRTTFCNSCAPTSASCWCRACLVEARSAALIIILVLILIARARAPCVAASRYRSVFLLVCLPVCVCARASVHLCVGISRPWTASTAGVMAQ